MPAPGPLKRRPAAARPGGFALGVARRSRGHRPARPTPLQFFLRLTRRGPFRRIPAMRPANLLPPPRSWLLVLAASLTLAAAPAGAAEKPRIYKWVDSNGIAHYTTDPERIPKALRNRIESLDRAETRSEPTFAAPAPVEPAPMREPEPLRSPTPAPAPEPSLAAPAPSADAVPSAPVAPSPATAASAPPPAPSARPLDEPAALQGSGTEEWATRNALPRRSAAADADPNSPEGRAALAREREALDARIAEVEAAITADENVLKDLITDPQLDEDTPLFDRPEFLEVSRRLPELQAQLDELRGRRDQLATP